MGSPGRAAGLLVVLAACTTKEPTKDTYYDRTIAPILQDSCASTNTAANCHVMQEKGNAIGNLSVASYEDTVKRRDLLITYGPYGLPNFLLKNVDPFDILLTAYDGTSFTVRTDIRHSGVRTIGLTSAGFHTLKAWLESGANANNSVTVPPEIGRDGCSTVVPGDPAFDPSADPPNADYSTFAYTVQSVVGSSCAAGNCHGSPSNSLRFACTQGTPDPNVVMRWNYFKATQYLSAKIGDIANSEILRRPLDPAAGGSYHEGGAIFASQADGGYVALLNWANEHGPLVNSPRSPGFDFFAKRVQPMLIKKGCMVLGCHSAAMFHDYRLHPGSGGNFSVATTATNYELTRAQIAMESPDPNASRLVAKNLLRPDQVPVDQRAAARGILHRGGALLDDFAGKDVASPKLCDMAAAETGKLDDQHAYCVIARWIQIEQADAKLAPLSGVVYVKRRPVPPPDLPQDFANYAGSSDLCFAALSMDPVTGVIAAPGGGGCKSLLTGCGGLSAATADVRHPSVSWKGSRVAFAARNSAAEPFAIWTVNVDGSSCAKNDSIAAAPSAPGWSDNGAPIHDFDPVFAPDDRIVFASTRGNVMNTDAFDYKGPTRTPADTSRWNANLYVLETSGAVRQLTFLLNQELLPSMMSDGRLIFTAEKRSLGFYQLAGRRINLDGGDYHPLYAQRRTIGFAQMTEVVELANKNFAAIFSDQNAAHGAGTLDVFNRSVGPDQHSADATDYASDPAAIDWPVANFYLHSLGAVDARATGHTGPGNVGAYRSPAPLPNGQLLVSYAANATDLASFSGNFDIYIVDSVSGQMTQVTNDAATDELSAVAVYERMNRGVFRSRTDEPNGHTRVYAEGEDADHPANVSDITVLDAPILGSLLFQNTRTGLDNLDTGRRLPPLSSFEVYEDLPPSPNDTGPSPFLATDAYGPVYARRRLLGTVPVLADGSARMIVPGGVPIVLRGTFALDGMGVATHFQREEMQFYPGEYAHQSFPRSFFNGMCGGCHGSVSGRETDLSTAPDILTQASRVNARSVDTRGTNFSGPPGGRGPEVGPMD